MASSRPSPDGPFIHEPGIDEPTPRIDHPASRRAAAPALWLVLLAVLAAGGCSSSGRLSGPSCTDAFVPGSSLAEHWVTMRHDGLWVTVLDGETGQPLPGTAVVTPPASGARDAGSRDAGSRETGASGSVYLSEYGKVVHLESEGYQRTKYFVTAPEVDSLVAPLEPCR